MVTDVRILHTSDWHLGRSFHRVDLLDAQAGFADRLVELVRTERVDAVLVAGDVYDRALPAVDVVALLDDLLARLVSARVAVMLSSGNHDSARRLGFGSRLLTAAGVHLHTDPARVGEPSVFEDRYGPVAVYPVPYLEPALVGPAWGLPGRPGHQQVLGETLTRIRADLSGRPAGIRSVLAAHAFVVGGQSSDSERDISVGGVSAVPMSLFDGLDYVALGHLHGRQQLSPAVRYSGSPMPYSFSETGQQKGCWLVELGPAGLQRVDPIDLPPARPLARIRGRLEQLLIEPRYADAEPAWCQVTLTDPERPAAAMERVRARFPHALELRFEPEGVTGRPVPSYADRISGQDDLDLCCGFLQHVRTRAADPVEAALLRDALEAARRLDAEERGDIRRLAQERPDRWPEPDPQQLATAALEDAG
jgi:DNA repair protein SbcD/Mre11